MTNFEKYFDDLYAMDFAFVNGVISVCQTTPCSECELSEEKTGVDCYTGRMKWLKTEYKEPSKISIPEDTPIDTRVLVSDDGEDWVKRHYAGCIDGVHYAWGRGKTSWTTPSKDHRTAWVYMKLYNEVES